MSTTRSVQHSGQSLSQRRFTPGRILGPQLTLIIVIVALLLFGLVMVFSASAVVGLAETGDSFYFFKRQLVLVGVGLVGLVIAALIPYHVWKTHITWVIWGGLIILLAATLIFGNEELGGKRWLDLFGFNFQPSEFAKIAMMLIAATLVVRLNESNLWNPLIAKGAIAVGLPALLIGMQPDLGTLIVAVVGVLAVAWFGKLPLRAVLLGLLLIAVVGVSYIGLESFRQDRISSFMDPWADPLGGGYQIINSYYAFGDGGLFGVGLGLSRQKFQYLPEAQNDFIFAIIGEELGMIGAIVVVALFVVFVLVSFRIGRNAPDLLGRVIACSSATLIAAQAFLNILCVIGFFPITGKPLPFISAGGTSMIASLTLVGLIFSVSLHSNVPTEAETRRDELRILDGGAHRSAAGSRPAPQPAGSYAMETNRFGSVLAEAKTVRSKSSHSYDSGRLAFGRSAFASVGKGKPSTSTTRSKVTPLPQARQSAPVSAPVSARRKSNPALNLSPARNLRKLQDANR